MGKKAFGITLFITVGALNSMEPESSCKSTPGTSLIALRHQLIPVHCIHDVYAALAPYLHSIAEPGKIVALWDLDCTVGVLDDLRLHPSVFDFNVELVRRLQPSTAKWDPFTIVMPDLRALYKSAYMRPLEQSNGLSKIIALLQNRNIPNLGITARSTPLIEATIDQLARDLHIKFNQLSSLSPELTVPFIDFRKSPPAKAYADGVCCCGMNSKGLVASELFYALGLNPKIIIVADDSKKNLETFFTAHPFRKVIALHMQIPTLPDMDRFEEILRTEGLTIEDTIDIHGVRYPRWQLYPSALKLALDGPTGGSEADLRDLASPMSPGGEAVSPVSCRGRFEGGDYFAQQISPLLKNPPNHER